MEKLISVHVQVIMMTADLPEYLRDKIYEIKTDDRGGVAKLTSYFPLSDRERQVICDVLGQKFESGKFSSIFSDLITDEEWERTKMQIKKRFDDELFNIDKA